MRIAIPAAQNASTGATSAGTITLSTRPWPFTAPEPAATKAAPATPPMSACEELEGRPAYQVARFQAMAPMRPANTIVVVIALASTMPLATVAATCSEMNAPTKFRIALIATAAFGDMARVETVVAIALAVSWKPFVKSNASAVTTTMTRMMSPSTGRLGVLDDDALEHVGDALGGVDGVLEPVEDVLPADDHHRVDPRLEQR